jgi:hypothetical protein
MSAAAVLVILIRGIKKYTIEVASGGITSTQSFIKIGSGVQKLLEGIQIQTHKDSKEMAGYYNEPPSPIRGGNFDQLSDYYLLKMFFSFTFHGSGPVTYSDSEFVTKLLIFRHLVRREHTTSK